MFLRCPVSAPVCQVLVAGPVRSVELCSGVIQKSGVMVSLKMCLSSCIDYLFAGLFSFCITGCLAGFFFSVSDATTGTGSQKQGS